MLPSMYTLMYPKVLYATECFITHITVIWTLSSMYTLMYLQATCFTECFITHITARSRGPDWVYRGWHVAGAGVLPMGDVDGLLCAPGYTVAEG
jgi:hypothetical protein